MRGQALQRVGIGDPGRGDARDGAPPSDDQPDAQDERDRSPTASMTTIAANVASMYRDRLSPRATAFFSVPQLHSEPAIAAP